MRVGTLGLVIALLVRASLPLHGETGNPPREFPLPLSEIEHVLYQWLTQSGFQVSRALRGPGQVELNAKREGETWEITLKTRSPLATEVSGLCLVNGQPDEAGLAGLLAYLAQYLNDVSTSPDNVCDDAPAAVLSKRQAVVCINAVIHTGPLQSSGFLIDRQGLILSTAHDLQTARELTVTLSDGRTFKGHLLKMDVDRDLALLAIKTKVDGIIFLERGRSTLTEGERLYAVGCPGNIGGAVHTAVLSGPLRWMNSAPLLEVIMKTLPGGSGSPVFDREGKLVAMVKGRYRGTDTVGFLTPLDTMKRFLIER
jgi:serine protease Do